MDGKQVGIVVYEEVEVLDFCGPFEQSLFGSIAASPEVFAALRRIAEAQGRQSRAELDDALREYIDRQQKERPRRHVVAPFAQSLVARLAKPAS